MQMVELIRKKRDRQSLNDEEIRFFVEGVRTKRIPDYQTTALLMAIWLNGMEDGETLSLTEQMLHSGDLLEWADLPGSKVDKHSTGGVGDTTSLILAPIVASTGLWMPMIAGRGLGHTGGTLDKLESIPGFCVNLDRHRFRSILTEAHLVIGGQTETIAPVDKKLYALRDVTATVESIPLIASSILSKKLAEGIDALVLDIKVGSGAFMKTPKQAGLLAHTLVRIGAGAGKQVTALVTNMDQPLGTHVGNSLEVIEAVHVLSGRSFGDLADLSFELAAHLLVMGGKCDSMRQALSWVRGIVQRGEALAKFRQLVALQGGDAGCVDDVSRLPLADQTHDFTATKRGIIQRLDAERVGSAAMALGAGRRTAEDRIDPGVGLILHGKIGDRVEKGRPLATIFYHDAGKCKEACGFLEQAYLIGEAPPKKMRLVRRVLSSKKRSEVIH